MPLATVVVPAYNVSETISETLDALLAQTYENFEIIVVNDGSTDSTGDVLKAYEGEPRLRVVNQLNRGLAGARNTGIAEAKGEFIGFCDSDDVWLPEKLEAHVAHLLWDRNVGISFSGSILIDESSKRLKHKQSPKLKGIGPEHILMRNPIGNGSAPVIRRQVFDDIAYRPKSETSRDWYFDETFRQSEDIECWVRIALTTNWVFEGLRDHLTLYRVNADGLSAATDKQLASWERMIAKLKPVNPKFFADNEPAARAYQLRYLARRAISDLDASRATSLAVSSLCQSRHPLWAEPRKTIETLGAAILLRFGGALAFELILGRTGARA